MWIYYDHKMRFECHAVNDVHEYLQSMAGVNKYFTSLARMDEKWKMNF